MRIYLITFIISLLLFKFSFNVKGNSKIIIKIVALMLPCLLAGFRGSTVGTDVSGYLLPLVEGIKKSNDFGDFLKYGWWADWHYRYTADFEMGFVLLIYIVYKVFGSITILQMILQLLCILPIYIALKRTRNQYMLIFGMIVYYLMFYNMTLNLLRQSIGMSFVFLCVQYYSGKEFWKSWLCWLIAVLFHNVCFLGILILAVYRYLESKKMQINSLIENSKLVYKKRKFRLIIIICISLLGFTLLKPIANILQLIGLEEYAQYITGNLQLMPNQVILRMPIIIIFLYQWKTLFAKEKAAGFYIAMMTFDFLCSQLLSVFIFSNRIGLIFSEYYIISLSQIIAGRGWRNQLIRLLLVTYLLFYWWFYYVYRQSGQTVPYVFI